MSASTIPGLPFNLDVLISMVKKNGWSFVLSIIAVGLMLGNAFAVLGKQETILQQQGTILQQHSTFLEKADKQTDLMEKNLTVNQIICTQNARGDRDIITKCLNP